jgi:CheY-like chemotaxis protein
MRQHPKWKAIPIVALVSDDRAARECYDLSVNACIDKPTTLDALAALVVTIEAFWFSIPVLLPSEWKES